MVTGLDQRRRQRGKNIAVALILFAFVTLFYLITVVKLASNVSGAG